MADAAIGMERAEKHWSGRKNNLQGRSRKERIPILYQQPERRYGNVQPGSAWALEYRKYALAFKCNL